MTAAYTAAGCATKARRTAAQESVINCRHQAQQGLSAIERGDWAEAERCLAQATKTCPVDAEARQHFAEALWQRGKPTDAIAQLEEAVKLDGENGRHFIRLAEMQLTQGQVTPARRSIDQAIDLDPKSPEAWAVRGQVVQRQNQPHQAIADFNRALSIDPDNQAALLAIAELYLTHGQPQRALAHLQSLVDTYPDGGEPTRALYLLGLANTALHRYADAVAALQAADRRAPNSPEVLARLAEALLMAGQADQAESSAQRALAIQGDYAPGRLVLSQIQTARRQQNDSLRR